MAVNTQRQMQLGEAARKRDRQALTETENWLLLCPFICDIHINTYAFPIYKKKILLSEVFHMIAHIEYPIWSVTVIFN